MEGGVTSVNDIQILQEMLSCNSKVALQQQHDKSSVELRDQKSGGTATIRGLPQDSIVIRAEDFENPLTIFDGSKGECKRADFVIVAIENSRKWIICIETRARKSKSEAHIKAQLKGAQCFIGYCRCIGRSFWGSNAFLDGYEYRFVSIGHTNVHKRKTQPKRPSTWHSSPENFLKVPGKLHHFSHLI